MSDAPRARWPGRVAVGVVRSDPPEVYLAEDEVVLSRLLALQVVARAAPSEFTADALTRVREALLEERWADAVVEWMQASDLAVDGYADEVVWTERDLDEDRTAMEIRMERIFDDVDT
jgi:hypothetical protein